MGFSTVRAAVLASAMFMTGLPLAHAGAPAEQQLVIHAGQAGATIDRDIFGQFAEHLGGGIYDGLWVGKDSPIPNVRGIRSDVVAALRAIKVPVVRWPGGCFADEYHWRKGIGPADAREATVNANWGNVIEPNSFGTDEFMDFIDQIGAEAYINVNVGSGTPQEAAEWLEYMTTDQPTKLGKSRAANGHPKPYRIKYLGIGNESWGCGGAMTADAYVDRLKLFSTFVHNFNPEQGSSSRFVRGPKAMQRIAVGPEDEKPEYTQAVMKAWQDTRPWRWGFEGLSLHHYTMGSTPMFSPATGFGEADYIGFVKQTKEMEALVAQHSAIMDTYDPQRKVSLVVDEWGVWLKPMAGTNPNFLKQQNSLRDALLAALNLNMFARHADRIHMANIAQMANVLQSMVLTDGPRMVLTPTYQVFRMYVPFQDAQFLPVGYDKGQYTFGGTTVPKVDVLAARAKDGKIWVSVANVDPNQTAQISLHVDGVADAALEGTMLTADSVATVNSYDKPDAVAPRKFVAALKGGLVTLTLPSKSLTVFRLD